MYQQSEYGEGLDRSLQSLHPPHQGKQGHMHYLKSREREHSGNEAGSSRSPCEGGRHMSR